VRFCHTPHQTAAANGQDPLWNHTLSSAASYGVYASATLNATPTDLAPAVAGSASVSALCMSCHDGTIGVGSMYNDPNSLAGADPENDPAGSPVLITGSANLGTDLTNDHPVNFATTARCHRGRRSVTELGELRRCRPDRAAVRRLGAGGPADA
jgi:hypothetical protein